MDMIERLPHYHQWFSTGEMKPGQIRCIECGKWGETYDAEKAEIERLAAENEALKKVLRSVVVEMKLGIAGSEPEQNFCEVSKSLLEKCQKAIKGEKL